MCLQTAKEISNLITEDQPDPIIVLFVGNIERPTERHIVKILSFLST